jgi:VanZ family protein
MLRPLNRWLPVVLWMGFIFVMSTGLGSAAHTSRFIIPILHWLLPHAEPGTIDRLHFLIRKAGHLTEYAVLALLLRRALARPGLKALGLALLITAVYAASDEFHQSFVPGRTASVDDVLIDTTGALLALTTVEVWRRWRRNPA